VKATAASGAAPAGPTAAERIAAMPPPAGYEASQADADRSGGSGGGPGELVTTAVQAVGEAAQLGVALGRQAVGGLLSRLPKP
jgi:hypothetical protein